MTAVHVVVQVAEEPGTVAAAEPEVKAGDEIPGAENVEADAVEAVGRVFVVVGVATGCYQYRAFRSKRRLRVDTTLGRS